MVKRKSSSGTKQKSSKILVRNVPFEATQKELRELFGTFGELKTVRLPKKLSGTGPHRGFAFIDFLTKQDAKVSETSVSLRWNFGSSVVSEIFCSDGCATVDKSNAMDLWIANGDFNTFPEGIQITVYKYPFIRTAFGLGMGR